MVKSGRSQALKKHVHNKHFILKNPAKASENPTRRSTSPAVDDPHRASEPGTVNSDEAFKDFMPDYTDVFLAGVWLVHGGIARTADDMNVFASKDIQDPRRRAFIGLDSEGHIVLGACTQSASSEKVAEAAAAAGIQEAVLLDSGFSTSLVFGEDVKASGHSTETIPSRPVPHAIVLIGTLDPTTAPLGVSTFKLGQAPQSDEPVRKKRRRRRKSSDEGEGDAEG